MVVLLYEELSGGLKVKIRPQLCIIYFKIILLWSCRVKQTVLYLIRAPVYTIMLHLSGEKNRNLKYKCTKQWSPETELAFYETCKTIVYGDQRAPFESRHLKVPGLHLHHPRHP